MDAFTPIQRAARIAGGASKLAEIVGCSKQQVGQWLTGARPVPAERAPVIEQATGIPCEELCGAVPWGLVRAGLAAPAAADEQRVEQG